MQDIRVLHPEDDARFGDLVASLRAARERIRRDQANLRALIENTPDAIWSMNLDFGIVAFNSAASLLAMKLSGQPMTAGADFLKHLPPAVHARWRAAALRIRNRERFREEHGLSWNGKDYTFDMSFNPVCDDGLVTGMAMFGKDITAITAAAFPFAEAQASMRRLMPEPSPVLLPVSGPMRILVVDDNPVNQLVLAGFLEKFGYAADLADDGRKAVDANRKKAFDLIFMDCRMPIMDGFDAVRAIRSEETGTGEHVRILAMTADVTPGIEKRCLEAGMDGYFAKPLPMEAMKGILDEAARMLQARGKGGRMDRDAAGVPAA